MPVQHGHFRIHLTAYFNGSIQMQLLQLVLDSQLILILKPNFGAPQILALLGQELRQSQPFQVKNYGVSPHQMMEKEFIYREQEIFIAQ